MGMFSLSKKMITAFPHSKTVCECLMLSMDEKKLSSWMCTNVSCVFLLNKVSHTSLFIWWTVMTMLRSDVFTTWTWSDTFTIWNIIFSFRPLWNNFPSSQESNFTPIFFFSEVKLFNTQQIYVDNNLLVNYSVLTRISYFLSLIN